MENLTPPANGKNAPDGAPPADQPHYRHRDAPRRNHCRQCRPKARAAAHAAPSALAFFFCPSSRRWPCCLPAAPDRLPDRCGSVTARPGRWPRRHPAAAADHPAHLHRQPEADRHQQQRQRRTDDPAAHKLHSLHTLPDLTAASSPPPAPTDTAPRKPCRPPAAADHPANSQKPPTAARRRRGQILYLTGIWPLQYSQ